MKQLKTLRVRFAIWVASLLALALIGMGVYLYYRMAHNLTIAVDDNLRLSSAEAIVAVGVTDGQISFDVSLPEGVAAANRVQRGLTIRIFDPSGKLVKAFGPYSKFPVNRNVLVDSRAGKARFSTFVAASAEDDIRAYTAPVLAGGQVVAIVQVAQNVGNVQDTLDSLRMLLFWVIPLMVVIAAIGGYFLAARALAPIDAITRTARRISAEDLSKRIDLPWTDDEVGRLVTTFDEMLARLDQSFQRQRQFMADVSHELRTPLTAMQTILSVIRQERRSPEEYEQALDDMAEVTERLNNLTENLLDLARREAHPPFVRRRVDLSNLLLDVSDSLRPLAEQKGLALDCNVPDGLAVTGDSDELIRLVVNLLDNAIQFTSQGRISLAAGRQADNTIEVSISDSGMGIPPEHLSKIFDRFHRVDKSRTQRGTGLGLAIAREIALEHAGCIDVHSEPGQGSTFLVTLPASPPPAGE